MSRHARHGSRLHHRPHRPHTESSGPRPDRPTADRGPRDARGDAPREVDARPPDERPEDLLTDARPPHGALAIGSAARVVAPQPTAVPIPEPITVAAAAVAPLQPSAPTFTPAPTPTTNGGANGQADVGPTGCTTAQMRRFIKSRPWIPMHELRRRFGINGHEDDVTPVPMGPRTLFVGLPEREGRMLGELLRGGDVGYELSVDPDSPIVIGVFPMRPVARP